MPRPRTEARSAATRTALFIFGAATDAGFKFHIAGAGKLEVQGPTGMPDDVCEPVIKAVREHGAEILRLLRWFTAEADQGRIWRPRPEPRTPPQ
jgi:hypothetical protein